MDKELYKNFSKYEPVYHVLQDGVKDVVKIISEIMEITGYGKTKAYSVVNSLKEDPYRMVAFDEERMWIDEDKFHPFIEDYMLYFNVGIGVTRTPIDNASSEISKLKAENERLKKENESLKVDAGIILLDTLEVVEDEPYDDFLVGTFKPTIEEEEFYESQRKWTRDSFYKVIEDEDKELNEENEKKRTIRSLCKDLFFLKRKEDIKVLSEMKEADSDRANDVITNRRKYFALRLLHMDDVPNKDKIAMYASFGRYKNQEMESLINYCNDECINANLMIETLEEAAEKDDFEGLRDFFRQMIKSSHSALKMELAKELIRGEWYIVCDYNGKKQKFQLMPVEEIVREEREDNDTNESSGWDNRIASGGGYVE